MTGIGRNWLVALVVVLGVTLAGGTVTRSTLAQSSSDTERALQLDRLFRELAIVQSADEANELTDQIWSLWLKSGDPIVDAGMRTAIKAMNARRLSAAIVILDSLVEKAPGYAEAWNKRATVHYMMGRHDESLRDIEATLKLEPRHFGALSGKALVLTAKGDKAGALEAMDEVLQVNPFSKGAQQIIEQNGGVFRPRQPI